MNHGGCVDMVGGGWLRVLMISDPGLSPGSVTHCVTLRDLLNLSRSNI